VSTHPLFGVFKTKLHQLGFKKIPRRLGAKRKKKVLFEEKDFKVVL